MRRDFSLRQHGVAALPTLGGWMLALLACMNAGAAEPEPTVKEKPAAAPGKPLDLRTPDVARLVTPEELERLTSGTVDEEREIEEVQVQRRSGLPPVKPVWPGLLAPFWALTHPTQAWRIFAPLPPDQIDPKGK